MKISPASVAGRRLLGWGVTEDELRRTRFYAFDLQAGGAITIALPMKRAAVLMKRKYLVRTQQGELADGRHLALVRHELCHVSQVKRWGLFGYWARHLWARIQSRTLLAEKTFAEAPCYEAQRLAARDFDQDVPVP